MRENRNKLRIKTNSDLNRLEPKPKMSSHSTNALAEEEDEESLRRAALKSMSSFRDRRTPNANSSQSSTDFENSSDLNIRTNNTIKSFNNYYNSHRNGSKRSNLIVLTKTETELTNSRTKSESKGCSEGPERERERESRKRVLPGRFSRLEREDEDSDDESDDCSDDVLHVDASAFTKTSDEELVCNGSEDTTTDDLVSAKSEVNEMNESIGCKVDEKSVKLSENCIDFELRNGSEESGRNECLATTAISFDDNRTDSTAKESSNSDNRKERIKLISGTDVSKSDVLERRKQKFGQSVTGETVNDFDSNNSISDSFENANNNQIIRKNRLSIRSRLSNNSQNQKRFNSKNIRNNSNNSISKTRSVDSSHKHTSNPNPNPNQRLERRMDSNDDSNQSSKKRLRSLVVMK